MCKLIDQIELFNESSLTDDSWNDKCLLERATGKFYTPNLIGLHVVKEIVELLKGKENLGSPVKVVEPFSGDGRLIIWFLEEISKYKKTRDLEFHIHLWETDRSVLEKAIEKIISTAKEFSIKVDIKGKCCDSFLLAQDHFGEFDVSITNPPWENLKPDRRELRHLNPTQKEHYVDLLKERASSLSEIYSRSKPSKKFSGWGVNLSRCGAELVYQLINSRDGIAGIILPSSVLADQTSGNLRSWIFENNQVTDLAYFVAEARLFEKVDQPSITITSQKGKTINAPQLWKYQKNHSCIHKTMSRESWDIVIKNGYRFPSQFQTEALEIYKELSQFRNFQSLEGKEPYELWAGRELDETGHKEYLNSHGSYLFVKGRMVKRFGMVEEPVDYVSLEGPKIPKSADFHRIVWRDVSRPSQKRRIHATILPPGFVTGNSLHVAYFRDGDLRKLKTLLGIVNSLVFESQVRSILSTAHVSLGAVRSVPIPEINENSMSAIVPLVDKCLQGDEQSCNRLEVTVAKFYGLRRDVFTTVLKNFEKITGEEKEILQLSPFW